MTLVEQARKAPWGLKGHRERRGTPAHKGPPGLPGSATILNGYCFGLGSPGLVGLFVGLGSEWSGNGACLNGESADLVNSGDTRFTTGLPMPSPGILKTLTVALNPTLGGIQAMDSYQIEIRVFVNLMATSLTCTIAGAAPAVPCSDNTDTLVVKSGDRIAVQMKKVSSGRITAGLSIHVALEKQ